MHREKLLSIAAVVVLTASFTGCSSKPKDAQLLTSIQSQMFADPQLKSANLQVASIDGQITLKGTVPNDAARYDAYKIASQTPGVTKVNDQMVVEDRTAQANSDTAAAPPNEAPAVSTPVAPLAAPRKPVSQPKPLAKHQASASGNMQTAGFDDTSRMVDTSSLPQPTPAAPTALQPPPQPTASPASAPTAAPAPPPPPQAQPVNIPAGTTVSIRMIDSIDSSVNAAGEVFHASLDAPLVDNNGNTIVPKGADVYVRLASVTSAGKMTGQSSLRLELVKLVFQGQSYPLVSTTYSQVGESRGKDTAKKVGVGAAIGTIIGAAIGGGKGAAVGAAGGAGAGGVYQGTTKSPQIKIPSETKLDFQLDQDASITVQPQPQSQSQPQSQPLTNE